MPERMGVPGRRKLIYFYYRKESVLWFDLVLLLLATYCLEEFYVVNNDFRSRQVEQPRRKDNPSTKGH
jgi:hypothetical protein